MKKRILVTALFLVFIFPFYVSALSSADGEYFSYSLSTTKAVPNDIIKLYINANKKDITAAGFRLKITYDESILKYIGTETSSLIKNGTMRTNDSESPIYSVYVCNTDKSSAPKLYGNIICYVFQVKSAADAGKTAITAAADQICDYDGNQLKANCDGTLCVNINEASSDEAYLTQLEPLSGSLTPVFSSEIHDYTMDVPYSVSSVEFQSSAGDGGSVKINRKTLYAAGKSTVITATVTSADKQNKTQYIVTVRRKAKPQSSSSASLPRQSSSAPQTSGTGKTSVGSKTKRKTKSGSSTGAGKTKSNSSAGTKKIKYKNTSSPEYTSGYEDEYTENTYGAEELALSSAGAAASAATPRNIYITANGMPAYMGGMLITIICIMCGIFLNLWLRPPNKK